MEFAVNCPGRTDDSYSPQRGQEFFYEVGEVVREVDKGGENDTARKSCYSASMKCSPWRA
jgi:hypothetical protein